MSRNFLKPILITKHEENCNLHFFVRREVKSSVQQTLREALLHKVMFPGENTQVPLCLLTLGLFHYQLNRDANFSSISREKIRLFPKRGWQNHCCLVRGLQNQAAWFRSRALPRSSWVSSWEPPTPTALLCTVGETWPTQLRVSFQKRGECKKYSAWSVTGRIRVQEIFVVIIQNEVLYLLELAHQFGEDVSYWCFEGMTRGTELQKQHFASASLNPQERSQVANSVLGFAHKPRVSLWDCLSGELQPSWMSLL